MRLTQLKIESGPTNRTCFVETRSTFSGNTNRLVFPMSAPELVAGIQRHDAGELIQDALPMLNADLREFLLTGATPEEWDAMFKEEDNG